MKKTQQASEDTLPTATDKQVAYRKMGWRGIDSSPPILLNLKSPPKNGPRCDRLDMTSMVDVTFLLLIFFMVTASFSLHRALEQPEARSDCPGPVMQKDAPLVRVLVDATGAYYVGIGRSAALECPSENEMKAQVRRAFEDSGAERLVILAHEESRHHRVIAAWNAGILYGVDKIELRTTNEVANGGV